VELDADTVDHETADVLQVYAHRVDAQPMEPLIPALDAPARGVTTVTQSAGLMAHHFIERHRATITTALIIVLVFAVSIHFTGHGVPMYGGPFHHPPR